MLKWQNQKPEILFFIIKKKKTFLSFNSERLVFDNDNVSQYDNDSHMIMFFRSKVKLMFVAS